MLATASLSCVAPLTTAGRPKPTSAVPGATPRSPFSTDGPVLVTVAPPRTDEWGGRAEIDGGSLRGHRNSGEGEAQSKGDAGWSGALEAGGAGHQRPP